MLVSDRMLVLTVDGVKPDAETIASGEYGIIVNYYAIIRADEPVDSFARRLIAFINGADGQEIVMEAGFVPH
jgi:phosphate transport system substrate-binding protein